MDLGATPGIAQSMPGDNGADGHADAHSLWSLRGSSLSPKSRCNKNMLFLFFCNLTYISHLYSAGNDRNKSKGIGFFLPSPALWPKVQGGWGSAKGTSVVVYHQPTLAATEISSFLLDPQWSVLH